MSPPGILLFSARGVGGRFAECFALADERDDRVVVVGQQLEEVQRRREEEQRGGGKEALQDFIFFLPLTLFYLRSATDPQKSSSCSCAITKKFSKLIQGQVKIRT